MYVCNILTNLYKLPKRKLTNANILSGSDRFGSSQNKSTQLQIQSWNSDSWTVRSLPIFVFSDKKIA